MDVFVVVAIYLPGSCESGERSEWAIRFLVGIAVVVVVADECSIIILIYFL